MRVVVADNDGERHEGYDLCLKMAAADCRPLDAVIAPERGIAQVRNVLIAHALADRPPQFVAMLDDDEWPAPQWLDRFLAVQKKPAPMRWKAPFCSNPKLRRKPGQ